MDIITFLQNHMLTCPSKALLHMDCPGCGMQRSVICLLKGDLKGSLMMHPATIPLLAMLCFLPFHLLFRFKKGAMVIVILQITVAIITLSFYIYKVLNHKIFS